MVQRLAATLVIATCAAVAAMAADRPVKIVALGDSLVAGYGLPANAAVPVQLEKALSAKGVAVETLAKVGLGPDVAELSPAELSGGMRKRVGLARAIATKPEIIFFDEPTTGLDPIMSDVIDRLIVQCVQGLGATALSITHDMNSARKISHRMAMLYQGKIIWQGPVADIDRSNNPYVDQFIHGRAEGPIQMQVRA